MKPKTAVILAAGFGTRFGFLYPPKPLLLVNDPLISYPLRSLAVLGINKVFVTTNPWSYKLIKNYLDTLEYLDTDVEVLWSFWEENGASLILGLKRAFTLDDKVILTMSDHIFEPILPLKAFEALNRCEASIAADKRPKWVDIAESTKIKAENSLARFFGKSLSKYDFIDTGVFGFRSEILKFIVDAYKLGAKKVSDILNHIADKVKICIVDVSSSDWIDVDTLNELIFKAPSLVKVLREKLLDALINIR